MTALLELARRELPSFFATASEEEIAWLEALVAARAQFVNGISRPRLNLSPAERTALERETDAREREFSTLRDLVRTSPTYATIPATERDKLTRVLLEPPRSIA